MLAIFCFADEDWNEKTEQDRHPKTEVCQVCAFVESGRRLNGVQNIRWPDMQDEKDLCCPGCGVCFCDGGW